MRDVLEQLRRQTAEAEAEAARRAPVLALIKDMEAHAAEAQWLAEYEADEQRYKVCSSCKVMGFVVIAGRFP